MTQDEADKRYPLHAEMRARAGERAVIQQVIDWIDEQGYEICVDISKPNRDVEYSPIQLRTDRLVAAIMGIDHQAFLAEKDQMVEDLRAVTPAQPPGADDDEDEGRLFVSFTAYQSWPEDTDRVVKHLEAKGWTHDGSAMGLGMRDVDFSRPELATSEEVEQLTAELRVLMRGTVNIYCPNLKEADDTCPTN